jgi:hypothetical protein
MLRQALVKFMFCVTMSCICLGVALGTVPACATEYVDGISDQSLPNWDNGFSNNSYFAGFFKTDWVSSGHIEYARYVVQWNAMHLGGSTLTTFEHWLTDVTSMGLTVDVALTSYNSEYPSLSGYKTELKALLKQAKALGHPIRYIEAWNEPNGQGKESAVIAADLTNSAYSACGEEGNGCTVIAGNVEDSAGAKQYEEEYRANLSPVPSVWGLHPYYSVETMKLSYYEKALEGLPNGGAGIQLWFTEVAARMCHHYKGQPLVENTEAGQAERAKWLVNILIRNEKHKPENVFYYEFMLGGHKQPSCATEEEDDALYVPSSDPDAEDAPRLAASYIWDGKDVPWGYTGGSAAIKPTAATLGGSVYPDGKEATYHFEYWENGSTSVLYSSEGHVGASAGKAEATSSIERLKAGTTYRYRLVAWNSEGATPAGEEHTFKTPGPVEAITEAASGEQQFEAILNGTVNPRGYEAQYYFKYGLTPSYGEVTPDEPAGAGETPVQVPVTITKLVPGTVYHFRLVATSGGITSEGADRTFTTLPDSRASAVLEANGDQEVFFRGTNGLIDELYYNGSWHLYGLGGSPSPGAVPAAVLLSNGNQAVFFRSSYGDIEELVDSGGWKSYGLGGSPAVVGGDPTVATQSNGDEEVFFRSTNGDIEELYYSGSSWQAYGLGGSPAGDPIVASPSEGHLIYFVSTNGDIEELVDSGGWKAYGLGGSPAPGAVPAAAIQGNDDQEVFFRSTYGDIEELYYNGTWHNYGLGGSPTAVGGDPTLAVASNGDEEVFFRSTNGDIEELYYNEGWKIYGLGGSPVGDPVVASPSEGHLIYFPSINGDIEELVDSGGWKAYGLGGEPN